MNKNPEIIFYLIAINQAFWGPSLGPLVYLRTSLTPSRSKALVQRLSNCSKTVSWLKVLANANTTEITDTPDKVNIINDKEKKSTGQKLLAISLFSIFIET